MTPAPKNGIVSVFVKQKLGLSGEGRGDILFEAKASSVSMLALPLVVYGWQY